MPETLATRAGGVTRKEAKFAREYVRTGNLTKAAQLSYDVAHAGVASSLAAKKVGNGRVQKEIERIIRAVNLKSINDDSIRASIADTAFAAKSDAVKFKGRELLAKVYGLLDESPKFQQNIQLNNVDIQTAEPGELAKELMNRLKLSGKVVEPSPKAE